MNTEQFGGRNYGYHAVVGRDGLFRSEPIVPGTVINTADGGQMWDGAGWKPLPGSWGSGKHLTAAELEKLMKAMKPSPEEVAKAAEKALADLEAEEKKFKFRPF